MFYLGNHVVFYCWMVTSLRPEVMALFLKEVYLAKLQANSEVAQNGHCRLWTGTKQASQGAHYGVINCKIEQCFETLLCSHAQACSCLCQELDCTGYFRRRHECVAPNSLCIHADHLAYELQSVDRARSTCVRQGVCSGLRGKVPVTPCLERTGTCIAMLATK